MTRDGRKDNHYFFDRSRLNQADTFQRRNEQRAKARMRRRKTKTMDHTHIANRFAAFFGGRPVGEDFVKFYKPEQAERERDRDREILAFVAEICGTPQSK